MISLAFPEVIILHSDKKEIFLLVQPTHKIQSCPKNFIFKFSMRYDSRDQAGTESPSVFYLFGRTAQLARFVFPRVRPDYTDPRMQCTGVTHGQGGGGGLEAAASWGRENSCLPPAQRSPSKPSRYELGQVPPLCRSDRALTAKNLGET